MGARWLFTKREFFPPFEEERRRRGCWLPNLGVVPDLALSVACLAVWVAPGFASATVSTWLIMVVVLEAAALAGAFLVTIALFAAFDGTAQPNVRLAGVVITAGFVAFVVIEVVRYDFWWPALALGGLIANRVVGLLTGGLASEDAKMNVLRDTIWSLVLYLFAVAPTFYIAVPMLGAAAAPLSAEHARWCVLPGDLVADFFDQQLAGDWCAEPHRALAGGALYFLAAAFRDMRRARRERG